VCSCDDLFLVVHFFAACDSDPKHQQRHGVLRAVVFVPGREHLDGVCGQTHLHFVLDVGDELFLPKIIYGGVLGAAAVPVHIDDRSNRSVRGEFGRAHIHVSNVI